MAVLTPLENVEAAALCAAFGLPAPLEVEGIAGGSVNSNFALVFGRAEERVLRRGGVGGKLFCRLYEEQDLAGAEQEAEMLNRLAAAGVPTPPPLRAASGRFIHLAVGKPAALFPWREGEMRCQAAVTTDDARRVGEALAKTHQAGRTERASSGRFGLPQLVDRLERISLGGDPRFAPMAPGLRERLERVQTLRDPDLPSGLIHGDLFRDNVLWCADRLSALLDFESACLGSYAYDLAVTVLAWCVGDRLDPGLASAMCAGYQSVRALAQAEREGIHAEASFAALRFTVTRITDYAMRTSASGPRVVKDWSRFMKRFEKLEALGRGGLQAVLFDA